MGVAEGTQTFKVHMYKAIVESNKIVCFKCFPSFFLGTSHKMSPNIFFKTLFKISVSLSARFPLQEFLKGPSPCDGEKMFSLVTFIPPLYLFSNVE